MSDSDTTFCTNCNSPIPAGAKFCPVCGQSTEEMAFCPHCGSPVSPTATFCNTCKQNIPMAASSRAASNANAGGPATRGGATSANRPAPRPASASTPTFSSAPQSPSGSSSQGESAAVVSLVCGIISVVLPLVLSGIAFSTVIGLVLGIVAVYQANNAKEMGVQSGMQTAGLALGIVGICLCGLSIFACIACAGVAAGGFGALSSLLESGGYY